ncbi:YebC/PmpR family DNA-binding transcriptional regulator [Schwartzia succinivorans]|jgi:YebC/PmpR family DNA-binding regulatory protein|uniref:Probable transcriptional regulatory protein SAMN02745190_00715 n=1 Tax=Schwartzia succinivorans DSM 10502 TaxID=1123243 RepID=A0A1M4UM60_9FIRM|nr:YebC/PmpR family DNA-binding transcriptional regulator [Schwartzia succinivorans]MBQ1918289.1 YebC/PmpR family DNA-binding transcriptional regulator [Schwartzia sp. (in: firmicutes)]MBE6097386.1 YebC/PmpR family DNA-binding transcriptional regulator [Schwartzia succinivorans]MBQ3863285.1 YebC/PmpR family DNA-binding transcriptional regulator [Schwartzia sp. (in: firmicutes)]MBQ4152351.1 YebC/PmpR family DNA-binding transcriptional regulator [Schwartzia sp. (in: firmicutes)]MCR5559406.1 YebC
MSGHSKWANIKRKKGANDAIRGKITTKIGREITIAVRMGGPDPVGNMRLKLALSKAKANNIPKDNIQRAIKKGQGAADGANYEEFTYEGYGPGGVAMLLDIMTDNRNRAAADVRHLFSKHGGNLGETGCVSWMFKQKAVFVVEKEKFEDEDALMDIVLEAGAEDMKAEDDVFEITAEPGDFNAVEAALAEKGIETASAEITMVPDTTVHLEGKDAQKMLDLIDAFEESDDVQNVYANYEIDEDSLEG